MERSPGFRPSPASGSTKIPGDSKTCAFLASRHRPARPFAATGIDWPGAAQVLGIRRDTGPARGPWESKEIAYGITSLPARLAGPRQLATCARQHWSIEVRHEVALRE